MSYFPQIDGAVSTQLPYKTAKSFSSRFKEMKFSRPYSVATRGSGVTGYPAGPLSLFSVSFSAITNAEIATLASFFDEMKGRFGTFTFLDPEGNMVHDSENFSAATWSRTSTAVGSPTTDPFGGSRATTLTSGSAAQELSTEVVPLSVLPAGFALCGSLYARSASSRTLSVALSLGSSGVIARRSWTLPAGSWVRLFCSTTVTMGGADTVRLVIGGDGVWSSGSIDVFGPQCSPTLGPGNYVRTPDAYGVHPKCRFDTDAFSYTRVGPNQNTLSLPIQEFN